ncbi:hypothetical protein QBC45DRAFT_391562 [Copromyces sp. CBS 386.78]|nr:hypothetical protein QBC45DRAFT_391562 [Copromyces sp. CBS 386.78]
MYSTKRNIRHAPAQKKRQTFASSKKTSEIRFSNSKSLLLRLPTEIRLMIYREIWTLPGGLDDESDSNTDSDTDGDFYSDSENVDRLNQQLENITAIQNLAITCQQIREELTDVYFLRILPKKQFHLGSVYPPLSVRALYRCHSPANRPPKPSPLSLPNYAIFEVLQSSSLFTDYIQHVSIHWTGCLCFDGSKHQPAIRPHGLEWVTKLESLKTVEVVFTDTPTYCDECLPKLLRLPRTLEKVVCWTTFIEDDDDAEEYEAELTEWYWRQRPSSLAFMAAKKEMEEMGEKNVPEGKVRLSRYKAFLAVIEEKGIPERKDSVFHKIEHHIGAVGVKWPLLDEV